MEQNNKENGKSIKLTFHNITTLDQHIFFREISKLLNEDDHIDSWKTELVKEIDIFKMPQAMKDQDVLRKMREDHITKEGIRFDEGCQMQYFRRKHTSIMIYDCKKCTWLGSNINDANRHMTRDHRFDFSFKTINQLIEGNQIVNTEMEVICVPALLSEKKEIIKILCPLCKQEIKGHEIKEHLIEYLKTIQDNNVKKNKDNLEYNTMSPIGTIYKIFVDIKAMQVVRATQNTGKKFQRTQ